MTTKNSYPYTEDHFLRNAFLIIGGFVLAIVLFIVLVVNPDMERQRQECEAKGGVIVGKHWDCIRKDAVL